MIILRAIADLDKPLTITEISRLFSMSKSKLHRYLTSFCRTGMLEKGPDLKASLGTYLVLRPESQRSVARYSTKPGKSQPQ